MFCQIDNLEFFVKFDKGQLSSENIQNLFIICVRHNSFKVAFHLNRKFSIQYDENIIESIFESLNMNDVHDNRREKRMQGQQYVELKLFFIR
mmetsp:Transcript_34665/g.53080  ORF Transcript_34665/g.53080 Transcript_34665/m.53080 type:complete len:92 (+) Transcript_34665:1649-1924(+)